MSLEGRPTIGPRHKSNLANHGETAVLAIAPLRTFADTRHASYYPLRYRPVVANGGSQDRASPLGSPAEILRGDALSMSAGPRDAEVAADPPGSDEEDGTVPQVPKEAVPLPQQLTDIAFREDSGFVRRLDERCPREGVHARRGLERVGEGPEHQMAMLPNAQAGFGEAAVDRDPAYLGKERFGLGSSGQRPASSLEAG